MWILRITVLILTCSLGGCATPRGAPCSNWSAMCGCYCGPGNSWSGIEPEPLGAAFSRGPTIEMSAEDRTSIRVIYVDKSVAVPQVPSVRTRADTWVEGLGGAISAILSTNYSKQRATAEYLEKNNIRVDEMLVSSFTSELADQNEFSVAGSSTGADAVVHLSVVRYGIEHTFNPLSEHYRAHLSVHARMVGSGGRLIWGKQCSAESADQATLNELYGDPETMRRHMLIVTKACAQSLVDGLWRSRQR